MLEWEIGRWGGYVVGVWGRKEQECVERCGSEVVFCMTARHAVSQVLHTG